MGSIPPISPYSIQSSSNDGLANQLWNLVTELRTLMGEYLKDPHSHALLEKLESCMKQMQSFLEKNKKQLFALLKGQGWPANGIDGYENFYDGALSSIHCFLEKPNDGSLDMVNEQTTQLHWLLTHRPS